MIKLRWKKEELNLLNRFYQERGENYLSNIIKKSPNSIRIKASRLNIKKREIRDNIILDKEEEQIILGSLMGDLYCEIPGRCVNARLQGGHGLTQKEYLFWKINSLKNLSFKVRNSKVNTLLFWSKFYPCLNKYYYLFYSSGKKKITNKILNKIDLLGIAVWYMDDGSYNKRDKYIALYTNGFTYNENIIIQKWFGVKWKIYPKIYSVKDPKRYPGKIWYYLNFDVLETKKFIDLIRDYIHPSMKYKIGVFNEIKCESNGG